MRWLPQVPSGHLGLLKIGTLRGLASDAVGPGEGVVPEDDQRGRVTDRQVVGKPLREDCAQSLIIRGVGICKTSRLQSWGFAPGWQNGARRWRSRLTPSHQIDSSSRCSANADVGNDQPLGPGERD